MSSITLRSPAKINLHLRVGEPDASGFHPLRSWMTSVDLFDTITLTPTDGPLSLTCDDPTLACDGTNLVHRAATAMLARAGRADGVAIHLAKRIPAGAGLGGGSGNAATTLIGVDRLLALQTPAATLQTLASQLGSDVPFFLGEPSAIATGRGETLSPTPPPRATALLIFPPFGIATARAYQVLDQQRPTAPSDLLDPFDAAGWARLSAKELMARLVNDLEPPAFAIEPRLAALRLFLESRLGQSVRMSGSGSTLFSLYDDPERAGFAAKSVQDSQIRTAVVRVGHARIGAG